MIRYVVRRIGTVYAMRDGFLSVEHPERVWAICSVDEVAWATPLDAVRTFAEVPEAIARLEAVRLSGGETGLLRTLPMGGVAVLDARTLVEQPFQTWEQAACFLLERHLRAVKRAVSAAADSLLERTSGAA